MATHSEEMLMLPDEYRVMFKVENEYWWYRGLRSLLKNLLTHYAPTDSNIARILDVGCGTGANLALMQAYGFALGIDLASEALHFCHARGIPRSRTLIASATDLPFVANTYDLAVSFDVICNIPNDVDTFKQVARVLKPGGYFIVQLPAYQWLWSMHDVAVGHQRRYSAHEVRVKLAQAGLHVERVTHTNVLLLPPMIVQRLWWRRKLESGNQVQSDLQLDLPRWLNTILSLLYRIEINIAARVDIPFGLSVVAIARKPA